MKLSYMKQATKKTKEKTIIGKVPEKKHLVLISVVILLLIGLVGGYFGWHYLHRSKPLSPQQVETQNSISDQERMINEDPNISPVIRSIEYINLAESYSSLGKCNEAKDALQQAKKITPPENQKQLTKAEKVVNSDCRF